MGKYKLCLVCSSKFYKPIIDREFTSLREIDEITEQFKNEEEFRNDPEIKKTIDTIKRTYDFYFRKIDDPTKKNGKIGIVDIEKIEKPYISPLYIENNSLESPKKLIKLILDTLKEENSGKYIVNFLDEFRERFNTEFATISGISSFKGQLEYVNEPKTKSQIYAYKRLLEIIKVTIKNGWKKETDELDENRYFKLRKMYDSIKDKTYLKNLCIKKLIRNKKMKANKKKSKEIIETSKPVKAKTRQELEEDDYKRLMDKAYKDAIEEGRDPSFFDIYDDRYKDELEIINTYYHSKRGM